jgi:hypothetical protein
MPKTQSTPPAAQPAISFVYNADGSGSITIGSATTAVAPDDFFGLFQQAQKHNRILVLPSVPDGSTEIHQGSQAILTAVTNNDRIGVVNGVGTLLHGVHDFCEIGTPNMVAPAKVPAAAGLPEAGMAAYDVLTNYPGPSYTARLKVDPGTLLSNTSDLTVHVTLQTTYQNALGRTSRGVGYLSGQVAGDASIVNKDIADALPLDETLQNTAAPMVDYFQDPIDKAQQTRKTVQKTKEKVTKEAAQNAQSKLQGLASSGSTSNS